MLIPARKLVMVIVACAASLLSVASVASADDAGSQFEAVGLAGASPLQDTQMSELRGAGFATGLSAVLFSLMPRSDAASAPGAALSGGLGSSGNFLPTLLSGLPSINLVAAELNDQPTVMMIGTTPQSLSCGSGIACPTGTTVYLYANSNAPSGSLSLNVSISH